MESLKIYIQQIASGVEFLGVLTILFGILYAVLKYILGLKNHNSSFTGLRQNIGKSILLGLEILIAADIMATIVTEPTLRSVAILGCIVIIRTFLSLSLQVEVEGKLPWKKEVREIEKDSEID